MYNFDPSSDTFHEELRRARADRGLTQYDLANSVGISHTMVTRYEAAPAASYAARPNPNTLNKIREFFGASNHATESPKTEGHGDLIQDGPLTIQEAKRRLALTFGVSPESVKISIEA